MNWSDPTLFLAGVSGTAAPAAALVPVSPAAGTLIVLGFVVAASVVLWWVGRLAEPAPAAHDSPPALRKAA